MKQIKRESKSVMIIFLKKHIKGEKHISQMNFAEYLRKSNVSGNNKVYYDRFLRNGFHEWCCYISKCRWDVQDLETPANQSFLVKRWNCMIRFFAGVCLSITILLLRPYFTKGQDSSACHGFLLFFFNKI